MIDGNRTDWAQVLRALVILDLIKSGNKDVAELVQIFFKYGLDPIKGYALLSEVTEMAKRHKKEKGEAE